MEVCGGLRERDGSSNKNNLYEESPPKFSRISYALDVDRTSYKDPNTNLVTSKRSTRKTGEEEESSAWQHFAARAGSGLLSGADPSACCCGVALIRTETKVVVVAPIQVARCFF